MATADGNNDDDIYRSHGEETEDECEYGDDDDYDYADECSEEEEAEEEEEPDADEQEEEEQRYAVLTEADILALQDAATAEVAEVLSIPAGFAAILLRHLKWAPSRVKDEWFSDDGRVVRAAVGLPLDGGVVVLPVAGVVCGICFDAHPAGRMAFAACAAHLYCTACWRGYVRAAVEDGAPRCLGLRCPDPACHAAVARELVYDVARDVDKAQYANFSLRSYVEDSGGGVRWCPGPGCARAVQLLHVSGGGGARDVSCDCGHGFCFGCGEEAHRPVSCETVRAWAAKNASDSENANWVLTHTKLCPGCRKHIEKNQGCNHMTCRCGHQFCWLCFDPWGNQHTHCSRYYHTNDDSNDSNSSDKLAGSGWLNCEDEKRRRQAKASLDRYLYHYDRWASNKSSMEAAVADMAKLERSGLREMAEKLAVEEEDLRFLTEAYGLIVDGRRVLRWAHAYGYFLDPERDRMKRELFEDLQDQANKWLERLHGCAELERKKLCAGEGGDAVNVEYREYKKKVEDLTKATRHYFGNLVKAFENDLPEFNSVNQCVVDQLGSLRL